MWLRYAHRTGVGTQRRERVEFAVAAEPHELLELLLEYWRAPMVEARVVSASSTR
jgi:hypothetical protein